MAAILDIYLPDFAYRKAETLLSRRGNMSTAIVGIYPVLDGHIGIHAMPKNWPQLLDALDMHWMADDDRFKDNRSRLRNDDDLMAQMYVWTAGVTKAEAYERGSRFRAPISPVNTMADSSHPRISHASRSSKWTPPPPTRCAIPGPPARMPATPPSSRARCSVSTMRKCWPRCSASLRATFRRYLQHV